MKNKQNNEIFELIKELGYREFKGGINALKLNTMMEQGLKIDEEFRKLVTENRMKVNKIYDDLKYFLSEDVAHEKS